MAPRERKKVEYDEALKARFKHLPEIKRIARHRHVPKAIKKAQRATFDAGAKEKKKEDNRKRHSTPGSRPIIDQKKRAIIKQLE